ncbi:MAG: DUF4838 domain-containing protein [Planctomycetota bacterium]
MRTIVFWIALFALTATALADKPKRLMPFLCRDAVVRESAERFTLIGNDGTPGPALVIGKAPNGTGQGFENVQVRRAAATLITFLDRITGGKFRIPGSTAEALAAPGNRIFVGAIGDPMDTFPELRKADAHGFVIATKSTGAGIDLHIVGASGTGTLYGTWFFLMNYADVRIVMPGEIGQVYPQWDRLEIPKDLYVLNPRPDFLLRMWSGESGLDQTALLADNTQTQRFQYHHNMFTIFAPEKFSKTNNEFYPVLRGERYIPGPTERDHWQPTFSEPTVTKRAIEYADHLFTNHKEIQSISLTVNDGGGFSELDAKDTRNGIKGINEAYYTFVNNVARSISERWPDKYVAFLPYAAVKDPPLFNLDDNVMMFIFSQSGNPKQVYAAWEGKVKHIGVYQWLYGMGWVIPNHWPHGIQDYLRWVRERGGLAFKGEAYVAWAQAGPKMWVLNNLLWNVDADVDALLTDFYEHAYGKEAAPAMARYFVQAEKIYERRRTPDSFNLTRWRPGSYQFQYATARDFDVMAEALEEAGRLAQGDANKRRIDMVARCFRWGRCYWDQYRAYEDLKRQDPPKAGSEDEAASLLDAAAAFYDARERCDNHRDVYIEPLPNYCVCPPQPIEGDRTRDASWWWRVDPGFEWGDVDERAASACDAITKYKKQTLPHAAVAEYWSMVAEIHPRLKPFTNHQRLLLLHPNAALRNLLSNGSFEEAPAADDSDQKRLFEAFQSGTIRYFDCDSYKITGAVSRDWFIYKKRSVDASVSLDADVKHDGNVSATARGRAQHIGVIRNVHINENRARYRLSFQYRMTTAANGFCGIMFYGVKNLPGVSAPIEPSQTWRKQEVVFTVNYSDHVNTDFTLVLGMEQSSLADSQIWFDDVRLEMLSAEGRAE